MYDDASAVGQLVLRERQGRDRAWWDQMRACYLPDSVVRVSWFQGSGPDFVDESIAMVERGNLSMHRMTPPVVHVRGHRAIAETSASIEVRTDIDGVEADLVSYTRLLVRAERRHGDWLIHSLDGIYERDTLTPAVPGTLLALDPAELRRYRSTYRCLSWVLDRLGYPVNGELPGDDRPDVVHAMYAEAWSWLERDAWPTARH